MVDIIVRSAQGVPEGAYLSLRVGDARRQMPFKPGSLFHFDARGAASPRSFSVDVFERLGSVQVGFGDLGAAAEAGRKEGRVEVARSDGGLMTLDVEAAPLGGWDLGVQEAGERPKAVFTPDLRSESVKSVQQQAAAQARGYLSGHSVEKLLHGMIQSLLLEQPEDPVPFMSRYLQAAAPPRPEAAPLEAVQEEKAEQGQAYREDEERSEAECGFPVDFCPEELPDLSEHCSMTAELLRDRPDVYSRLRDARTAAGVSLARCIKPGIDVKGHHFIQFAGAVAGDAECYEAFAELFDPLAAGLHGAADVEGLRHPCDMDPAKVSSRPIDPSGKHVLGVRLRACRNLSGMRMAPACSSGERREAERLLASALLGASGELRGRYLPLAGSESFPAPGMSAEDEHWRAKEKLLFEEPDSGIAVASGLGRDWPDARGVFVSDSRRLVAWINEEDHVSLTALDPGGDLRKAFALICLANSALEDALHAAGRGFAFSERLGFLGASPARLGTCLAVHVTLRLPLLAERLEELEALSGRLGVLLWPRREEAQPLRSPARIFEVCLDDLLGESEGVQTDRVHQACCTLVSLEHRLAEGEEVDLEDTCTGPARSGRRHTAIASLKTHDTPPPSRAGEAGDGEEGTGRGRVGFATSSSSVGSGASSAGSEVSSGSEAPEDLPDMRRHHSLLAAVLEQHPSAYARLRDKRTALGVSLGRCIKPGLAVLGHPLIKTVGLVAGDAESYSLFWEVFEPVVTVLHRGWRPEALQPCSLDPARASGLPPVSGARVLRARVSVRRNLEGLRFSPAASTEERLQAEQLLRRAVERLPDAVGGGLEGEYHSIEGRLAPELQAELRREGLLLEESDALLAHAEGTCRGWPQARGIFASRTHELVAWINEEEHLRLWSTDRAGDLGAAFRRLCLATEAVHSSLQEDGHSFARTPTLGYLTACPSHLGTALRAEIRVRLPRLGAEQGFRPLCARLGLRAVPVACEGDAWDFLSTETLGAGEAEQVGAVLEAVRLLLQLEEQLEQGKKVDLASVKGSDGAG